MLKILVRACIVLLALGLAPATSLAVPTTYYFASGSVQLRATLDGTTTSVISGSIPVTIPLGGNQVVFDADAGANGTLLGLSLAPAGPIALDLDQTIVALDSITIENTLLMNDAGATAAISGAGSFSLATMLTADVSGVFPDTSTFGPAPVSSLTSSAVGSLAVSGDTITLGLVGVNLATFPQLANPGAPDIVVKADFTFFGVVPEPGTALLLGMGLMGLSAARSRR
ncbi:MAG: PEP-CTERM sorting domain-containing protein [Myxococcales bacterium]|nr:PEP-CTERM sorting domain-containing protein [Myxococcales bacterium]